MFGAMNPMDLAPAAVGTELKAHVPVEIKEIKAAKVKEEVQDEPEVVQEETREEVAQDEREVAVDVQVEQAVEEIAEVTEAIFVETDRMVQEEVQKESTAGQGTPEIIEQVVTDQIEVMSRERSIGREGQAGGEQQTAKQAQHVPDEQRAKVDMSLPQELEEQANALQEAALTNPAPKVTSQVKTESMLADARENAPREMGKEEKASMPVFNSPVIDAIVKQAELPSGSSAQESLRFQLGSLIRPEFSADSSLQSGGVRSIGSAGSSNSFGLGESGDKEKLAAGSKKAAGTQLPKAQQDKVVERIQQLLKDAAATRNGNTMVVRLDPPNLGALTVRVTQKAGQVFARIIPESQDVEAILRGRVNEITHALTSVGIKAENIHISLGQERSESEMFQFNEFLNQNGGQESGEKGFSRQHADSHATLGSNGAVAGDRAKAAADAGWVA
jgi:flagellar hook-length control protein FliK